jgi:hypothetical protein
MFEVLDTRTFVEILYTADIWASLRRILSAGF